VSGQLQRLVIEYRGEEVVVRTLYRTKADLGPNTKARWREVTALARTGLEQALEALEGRVDVVGTSGFTPLEDVLLATTSPDANKLVKGA
jgi:hypothetical protein